MKYNLVFLIRFFFVISLTNYSYYDSLGNAILTAQYQDSEELFDHEKLDDIFPRVYSDCAAAEIKQMIFPAIPAN